MKSRSYKLLSLILAIILTMSLVAPAYATQETVTLEDGTYSLPDLCAGPSAMFNHFDADASALIVSGDTATIRFVTDGSTASIQKYTKLALGKSSELLETSYQTTISDSVTVIEGTLLDKADDADPDRYQFDIPLPKADVAALLANETADDIYIVLWNKSGSSTDKIPGWYKPSNDIYLSLGALGSKAVEPAAPVELTITNNTNMFKAVTASLETNGGATELVVALSGTGYHYLFKGTYEEAVANGDNTSKWIAGATNTDGKWEFRVPVAADESYIPVVAISQSYYEKYLNSQNTLARAFYPRQMTLDRDAKTLVTDDYKGTAALTVTNGATGFTVGSASLNTVGGPNSNGYAVNLALSVGSAYDKAFLGAKADITEQSTLIDVSEGAVALKLKWIVTAGDPDTIQNLMAEPFTVSFRSGETWTEYQFTVDEAAATLAVADIVETFGFTLQVGQYTEGADFHTASFTDVVYSLTDAQGTVYTPSNATTGMLTYSNLDASKTYTFTATREGWTVCKQGEWNTEAHAYDYIYLDQDAISVTITSADAGKNITDNTNPGMVFRVKPQASNAVTDALALVPDDLTIFTDATAAAVSAAVNAADPTATDADTLQQMAAAIVSALQGLVPKDGTYSVDFELTGNGMFKIIDSVALDVKDGVMSYRFINGSKTYIKLYIGTTAEANAAAESDLILPGEEATASTGKAGYNWTVPVSALETEIPVAAYSKSKNTFNSTGNFLLKANSLVKQVDPNAPVELAITNGTNMFKAVTASLETNGTELVVALSGTGYHYLFKGTYEEAVANGDDTSKWIAGATNTDGKWEFRVPVAADESYIPVVAISQSYYEKYLNSQNTLARAFYPRQMTLDRDAKTLVTDDYKGTAALTVTNGATGFTVGSASLNTVGGPNSNGYAVNLALSVGSAYDKAFLGAKADITEQSTLIDVSEGAVALKLKWIKTAGDPDTIQNLMAEPFTVSFRSGETWTEYQFTVDEAAATLAVADVVETFGFTLQVGQYTEGADFHTASLTDVVYALTDAQGTVYTPSNATTGMLTYSNLDASKTYTFTATREGWTVCKQGEWNTEAHAYEYIYLDQDAISVTITSADAGKNITDNTNPGMVFRLKPQASNAVTDALALVPDDLTIFTDATAAAVSAAVNAADPTATDDDTLQQMAAAIVSAVKALVPKDGSYSVDFELTGSGMFKIIDSVALDVTDGQMTYRFINGSKTYIKLYIGTIDEANAAAESDLILPGEEATASTGKAGYNWTVPISALETEIPIAAYSKSKSTFNSTGNFLLKANSLVKQVDPNAPVELTITNNTNMFKAVTASLETSGDTTELVVALSGTGYHYLFKGTYEEAVANGDDTSKWIAGATNTAGKWEFRIPVAADESYIPVVAISQSYYEKYLNSQNTLARAFYPRQMTLDREAKTLVTGDYENETALTVTNNVSMFKVNSAALETVGGPNSNGYKSNLILTMGSTSYDQAFIGSADAAAAAAETIALGEGNVFTLPVKWVETFGQPETLTSLLDAPFIISFRSASKQSWYERQFTVSEADGTLLIKPAPVELTITNNTNMFKAVTASLETNGGATELVVALSGTGYHYLFKGSYEEAVANGDDTSKWIAGATNTAGKWEFRIPVAADESYIPVVVISQSYYEKYLNSQNTLARAFYPRQMTLDRDAKTLVTDDYENSAALTVTNNVSMFKVNSAALETVGGPNSNGYKSNLILTMGSTSYDQAFIGSADAAATAAETIALGEGNVFTLPVKWVETFGQPETLTSLLDAPFIISFRSASKQSWYERQFTVSEADGTLLIKPAPVELTITNNTNMFKAVTASLETNGGATELVVALSGTGYHYLFKGSYEEAVANGDDTSKWIAGATNTAGKWEFRIPVAADESYIPVVVISQSYYEKYLNSQNTLARAFYPRQMTLDRDAKTLVTDDYKGTAALTVTNSATGFTVSSAALETVGGPNSNGYAVSLALGVGSAYDKAFLGAKADITEQRTLIDVSEGAVALKLKWIVTAGDPDTIQNLMAEPFTVSFRSGETWTEYKFTVNETAATLTVADVGSTGGGTGGDGGEGGGTGGDSVPRELSYSGDIVTAITAEGDRFGMFEPQSGTAAKRSGGNVVIHFVPKNKTIYNGLHLGLITDTLTKDVVFNADGSFDLTLSIDKCGKMIAIAPIKAKDGGTTAGQYYLAIPAADKLPSDDTGTSSGTGSSETTGTPETTTEITTVTNADGSVTETKAETTVTLGEDGGKTSVTTTTVTVTDTDGSAVTTVTVETAVEQPDGSSCAYVADAEGAILNAEVAFSEEAVSAAADEPIALPVTLPAAQDAGAAAELTISLPETLGSVAVAIPVTDVTVNSVIVLVHEDGTEEVLPEVAMTEAGLVLELEGSVTVKVVDNEQSFKDMPEAAWSNDAIHFMAARGLMNGVGHDAFAPDAAMDRGMIVTVLYRLARQPANAAPASFTDVPQGMWYSDAVAWAEAAGIVTGYGDSFGLRDPVTREQVAVMLWRLAGMPEAEAVDCGAHDWGAAAMSWAIRNGLIEGDESGYNTTGTATRAEVSAIVMRYINLI